MKSKIEDGGSKIAIFYLPYSILNGKKLFISSLLSVQLLSPWIASSAAKFTWAMALTLIKKFSDRK